MYPEFLEILVEGDKVAFMEMLVALEMGISYEAAGNEIWELNGETDYEYYFLVLMFDAAGNTSVDLLVESEFKSPVFINGLPAASATVEISEITAESARVKVMPTADTYGYYAGILTADDYADYDTEEDFVRLRKELAMYGDMFLEADDDTWSLSTDDTEYVFIASPFNVNGIDGYGPLVVEEFSTSGSTSSAINQPVASKTILNKAKTKGMLVNKKK